MLDLLPFMNTYQTIVDFFSIIKLEKMKYFGFKGQNWENKQRFFDPEKNYLEATN